MKKHRLIYLFSVLCILSSVSVFAYAKSGPIPMRNQMPLYLFYLQMAPERAKVVGRHKPEIDIDYTLSNVTVSCFTPVSSQYDIDIDAEVSRITLDLKCGIYNKVEIGLEVPYISLSRGYLDWFVEDFESSVGATTPRSRDRQGSNNYSYSFIYNNEKLIDKKHSTEGLGDVVLKAKYELFQEGESFYKPNVSLRSALKFPSASKNDLLGSGEFDYGFGVVLDKAFFTRTRFYGGLNIVVIQKPSFFSALNIKKEIVSGNAGVEYFLTDRFSLATQISGNTTPYPSSGTNALDESALDIAFGINYIFKEKKNIAWRFAFTENINSASSPDVSFNTGLNIGF